MTNKPVASENSTKRVRNVRRFAWTGLGALLAALLVAAQIAIPALATPANHNEECGEGFSYIKYQINDNGSVGTYESDLPGQVVTLTRVGISGNTYLYNNTTDDDVDDSNDLEIFRIVEKAGNDPNQVTENPPQIGTIQTASNISHITFCLREAPEPSPSPSPSESPSESPSPSPSPSESPSESPSPSPSPSESPTESPSPSPSPSESPTESPSPGPTITSTPTTEPTVEATTEVLPRRIERGSAPESAVKGKVLSKTGSSGIGSLLLAGIVLLLLGLMIVSTAGESSRSSA